jgi:adenylate cyclase
LASERVTRRLTAVLAADVAGYSRLVGNDEEGTLAQWKAHWQALIEPTVKEYHGRIVRVIGDGILVEFTSVVDAVRCAVEVQLGMAARNVDVPQDKRIEFRIGINFGELIIDGGDFWGDGVNIAARLEALAEPGGICVSGRVQEDAQGKLDIVFENAGEQQLKNIARPVRVYHVRLNSAAKAAPELALPSKPSIAVLPFDNMSADREQEYFCDGIVEDIITGLSRIRWVFVICRNSSFVYRGRAQNIKQIARELGVRYALEGSVRKAADRLRISAQLIEADNGTHLWAERYDRPLDDIFAVQDEITMCVVGAIEPSLRKAEIDRVRRQRPSNLNAYDLVLRSLPFVYALMPKHAENAIPLLRDALKLEPHYGLAHGLLSWCFHVRFNRGGAREADRVAAIRHAHEAIAHGADDATALAVAAFVIALDEHDATTALKVFDQALALSSSNIFALTGSAVVLAWMGNTDKTIERAKQALRFSPFDSLNFRANSAMSIVHFYSKRYAEAADEARTAIGTNATFTIPRAVLAASLLRLGRIEEARLAARSVLDCEPSFKIQKLSHLALEPAVFIALSDAWRELGLPE